MTTETPALKKRHGHMSRQSKTDLNIDKSTVRRVFGLRKLTPVDEDDTGITPLDIKRISMIRNLVDTMKKLD